MYVKFKNQFCNCSPSKKEGFGQYSWTPGSFVRLKHIPRLPDELFDDLVPDQNTVNQNTPINSTKHTNHDITSNPTSKQDTDGRF